MWKLQDRTRTATEVADEFARTAFEEPRRVHRFKATPSAALAFDATFRLVGGRQLYHLWFEPKTCTWTVEALIMH